MSKTVIGAALGECVHVAGVLSFLRLAQEAGWRTVFLGPATPAAEVVAAAEREGAELVGVSYRLTPETGERLLGDFAEAADELRQRGVGFVFGGTPPMAERARSLGFFQQVFDGSEGPSALLSFLRGQEGPEVGEAAIPQETVARIRWKAPYPILRHHYGQPTMAETVEGIARIAEAGALDVVSLGTDQDAQEHFFHPERQDARRTGAGGVPVRSAEDFRQLYAATRCGNYPLMRTYTGTDDFIALAEVYVETIHIAWPAVPILWFNAMDGRGPWPLEESVRQHMALLRWYAERGIPVEVNEPHHWGLRDAHDAVCVASGYLAAYIARACGVQDYMAQLMFNSPPMLSDRMDLAKMLAMLDMAEELEGATFRVWRQTRTGLLSYPQDPRAARAHLAASVYLQMALKPHVVHVVAHSEAHHAATADDVIEACVMAQRAIENALSGQPDMTMDLAVQTRRQELRAEAHLLLEHIRGLGSCGESDPLLDPATLAEAVRRGLLDAPHLASNAYARGTVATGVDARGACVPLEPTTGRPWSERERLAHLAKQAGGAG
jgi:methylmalonyl-CoA mutase cobalamin-binding subunit